MSKKVKLKKILNYHAVINELYLFTYFLWQITLWNDLACHFKKITILSEFLSTKFD